MRAVHRDMAKLDVDRVLEDGYRSASLLGTADGQNAESGMPMEAAQQSNGCHELTMMGKMTNRGTY